MGFPDEVYATLKSNAEMAQFLSVGHYVGEPPYNPLKIINELTNFFNFTLATSVKAYTENSLKKEDCTYLPSFYKMLFHKSKFVESEVLEVRKNNREKMQKLMESIINFLQKWAPTEDNMYISVKIDELEEYLIKDPDQVHQLIKKHNFYISLINSVRNCYTSKSQVEEELKTVIDEISKTIDERTSFFPIHPLQTKFENLFMSPLLSFSTQFNNVVESYPVMESQLFLKTLFNIVPPFLNQLGINRKPYDSALVLLLVRFLFDTVYEQNNLINKNGDSLLHDLVNTTFTQLKPPAEFSPQVEDKSTRIIDVFAYDEHFGNAIPPLQETLFYTNPFDILDCVDKSLFIVEKSATVYNNYQTMVFPFEVTFELFMAVSIASQVSNWGNMSAFVENYTPLSGLCPSFEFSKAKVVASAMQFQVMVAEMKGEHPTEEIDDKAKKATQYAANCSETLGDVVSNGIVTLPEPEISQTQEEEEKVEGETNNNDHNITENDKNDTENENIEQGEKDHQNEITDMTTNENTNDINKTENNNENKNEEIIKNDDEVPPNKDDQEVLTTDEN